MKGKDDMERTPFFLVIGKGDRTKILVKGGEDWQFVLRNISKFLHDK